MPRLTQDQLDARRNGIGSSDVAAILGVSHHQNSKPWDVFVEKVGIEHPRKQTPEMERGHDLEPILLKWFCVETGWEYLPGGTIPHRTEPWAFATIDGKVIGQSAIVECKAVSASQMRNWDTNVDDGIPHATRVQSAWQMWCLDVERVYVASMLGGPAGFRVFNIARDAELERMIVERCRAFWAAVQAGKPPEIDDTAACRAYLESKYPEPKDPILIDADEALEALGGFRLIAFDREKSGKAEKKRIDNLLVEKIGDHSGVQGTSWKATNKLGKDAVRRYRFTDQRKGASGEEE